MKTNGSFVYEDLDTMYRGMEYLIDYIYKDGDISDEDKPYLARPYRDMLHKIEIQREKIEDSHLRYEIKEFQRLGW